VSLSHLRLFFSSLFSSCFVPVSLFFQFVFLTCSCFPCPKRFSFPNLSEQSVRVSDKLTNRFCAM
jgi:hypothetical protein